MGESKKKEFGHIWKTALPILTILSDHQLNFTVTLFSTYKQCGVLKSADKQEQLENVQLSFIRITISAKPD